MTIQFYSAGQRFSPASLLVRRRKGPDRRFAQNPIQARFLRRRMKGTLAGGGDLSLAFVQRQRFDARQRCPGGVRLAPQSRFRFYRNPQLRLADRADAVQFRCVSRGRGGRSRVRCHRRGDGRTRQRGRGFFRLRAIPRFRGSVGNFFSIVGDRRERVVASWRWRWSRCIRWSVSVGQITVRWHANEHGTPRTGNVFARMPPVALDMLATGRTGKFQFFHNKHVSPVGGSNRVTWPLNLNCASGLDEFKIPAHSKGDAE